MGIFDGFFAKRPQKDELRNANKVLVGIMLLIVVWALVRLVLVWNLNKKLDHLLR